MLSSPYIESAKKIVDTAEIISFDIFDTLLIRPYLSPKNLFMHLEKEYSLDGFFNARINAEKMARKANAKIEDIKLDDIYQQINESFQFVKQIELDWEYKILSANPEMKVIWDYAKEMKKKIIIVSDMYLPSEFLKNVLLKNGFEDYDHLYVSSDYGKTKKTGALFKHIISELEIKPNDIAHFGDNKKGDYEIPQKLEINCLLYTQVTQQFFKENNRVNIFNKASLQNLGNSILISLCAWRWHKAFLGLTTKSYWENIGYSYAAPLAYGYTRWIEHTSKMLNVDHILFTARDGYLLQKVFKSFNHEIKNTYFYAPRILNLVYRLDYDPKNAQHIDTILDFFADKYPDIKKLDNYDHIHTNTDKYNFLKSNHQLFEKYAGHEFNHYKNYIGALTAEDQNIAIIDTKTIAFTSQKLLESSISKKVTGFYWSTILSSKINHFKYLEFLPNNYPYYDTKIFSHNWKFIEILLSSPEYPIKGVDSQGNAIYDKKPSQYEIELRSNFKEIEQGVDQFLLDINQLFGHSSIFLEGYSLIEWVNNFCEYPTNTDVEYMSKIKQANDISHKHYRPIFSSDLSVSDFLKHPNQSVSLTKKSLWKTIPQTILLNIFRPFKIKRQSNKNYQILLFPYLQRQYFVFWLRLFANFQVKLSIGPSN